MLQAATVLVLGYAYGRKFNEVVPSLWGMVRDHVRRDGKPIPLTEPGMPSLFGEHIKPGEDPRTAALRCAQEEFWPFGGLTEADFILLADGVETLYTRNTIFLLGLRATREKMDLGEGEALLRLPLPHVGAYTEARQFTHASLRTLEAVPPLSELWRMTA